MSGRAVFFWAAGTPAPPVPFPVGESSTFWLEVETDRAASQMQARFSLIEYRNASTT